MALSMKNSGKYLSTDWGSKRKTASSKLESRDSLSASDKSFLELTDIEIGKYDPKKAIIQVTTGEGDKKKIINKNYSGE